MLSPPLLPLSWVSEKQAKKKQARNKTYLHFVTRVYSWLLLPHPLLNITLFWNEFFLHLLFTSPFLLLCVCVCGSAAIKQVAFSFAVFAFFYFYLFFVLLLLSPDSIFGGICVSVYLGIRPWRFVLYFVVAAAGAVFCCCFCCLLQQLAVLAFIGFCACPTLCRHFLIAICAFHLVFDIS